MRCLRRDHRDPASFATMWGWRSWSRERGCRRPVSSMDQADAEEQVVRGRVAVDGMLAPVEFAKAMHRFPKSELIEMPFCGA